MSLRYSVKNAIEYLKEKSRKYYNFFIEQKLSSKIIALVTLLSLIIGFTFMPRTSFTWVKVW